MENLGVPTKHNPDMRDINQRVWRKVKLVGYGVLGTIVVAFLLAIL